MSKKAKCFELANEHGLTIYYAFDRKSTLKSSSVDLPDGFLDYDGRTGLYFDVYEFSATDFWQAVYENIEYIIMNKKRWQKDSNSEQAGA